MLQTCLILYIAGQQPIAYMQNLPHCSAGRGAKNAWQVTGVSVASRNTKSVCPRVRLACVRGQLSLQVIGREVQPAARCNQAYANAHTYHINSISMSSDQETFLSSDDLRINLWHLDVSDCSFNILDIKPSSMEELTEVCFRPSLSSLPRGLLWSEEKLITYLRTGQMLQPRGSAGYVGRLLAGEFAQSLASRA